MAVVLLIVYVNDRRALIVVIKVVVRCNRDLLNVVVLEGGGGKGVSLVTEDRRH